ncbi:MAG TPA: hypothetical protein VN894_16490 [Polyangiaceae bacterium]|nr:hypothetical protein [Polyangiaceae bacterium]
MSNSTLRNDLVDPLPGPPAHDPFAGPAILMTVPTTEPQREIWTAKLVDRSTKTADCGQADNA